MSTQTYQTVNPTTGEYIETYHLMSDNEVRKTLQDSHAAFLEWRRKSIEQRQEILRSVARRLRDNANQYSQLMTREMGKPISEGPEEIELCAAICDYEAQSAPALLADEKRDAMQGRGLITYEPMGVIFGIQPWNFPFYQVIRFTAANLMAGNTVLLKHAPNVWGCALEIERMFSESGLPDNVFRTLLIDKEQSGMLIKEELVRGVTFTGSPGGGSAVASQAADSLKKTVIELGGNDAYIVLEDADIDRAAMTCALARNANTGQTCVAAKRFVVMDSVYNEFRDKFLQAMAQAKYGDPLDPDTSLGPIARDDLRDTLHHIVDKAIDGGANCLMGGKMPKGPGYFYPPTVLEGPQPGHPGYDEEMFGPVASLLRASDERNAVEIANDSRYGLGGGVFSQDEERAVRVARQVFTGMVNINGYSEAQPELPFGGAKDSGYGREHGGFGLREFVHVKSILKHG